MWAGRRCRSWNSLIAGTGHMIASFSQCRPNDACSQPRDKKWECAMGTPRHHRDEAQTCLELAQLMIDPHAARIFRAAATQHIVQARELEAIETARLTPGGEPTPHRQAPRRPLRGQTQFCPLRIPILLPDQERRPRRRAHRRKLSRPPRPVRWRRNLASSLRPSARSRLYDLICLPDGLSDGSRKLVTRGERFC
jgi:hypothetical protein